MANSITFTVNIDDKGSLSLLTKESKKAADGIDKVDKTTKKAGKTSDKYSKQNKGVAGATSNGTKAFSKMTTGINTGIVPAYATLAANIFAVSAAFGALKRVAAFDQLVDGFQRTANESGQTASIVTRNLQLITDGAISSEQAFKSAAVGFSAGFSTAEIEGLTQVAKGASLALGRDMGDALDRLVRGTAKLEPEILDELGIFVRLDDAVKQYAESIGKTAGQLTQTERRQSFLNATLTQGKLKFAAVSESVDVNPYDRLAATFDSLSKTLIRLFDNVLGPFISFFANSQVALLGGLVLFSSTITSTMFPALDKLGGKFQRSAGAASESTKELLKDQKKLISGAKKEIKESSGVSKRSKFHKIQAKLIAKEKVGLEELRVAEKSLGQSSARRALKLEKLGEKATQAKKDELALINRQREAVEKLILAEQGRAPLQRKAREQEAVSSREGAVATAAGKIQEGGALDGFKTARTGLQEYREKLPDVQKEVAALHTRQGRLGNIMRKGAVASRLASVAIRLFGTAFVNAIPFIGTAIMVLGFFVTGLKALYNWIMKPSAAMQEFNDVIDGMDEKMKQLKETNSKLVTTYTEILLEAESLKVGMEDLSDETVANTVALAANMASGTAYANTLKVNSGIVGEFTNAMSKLTQEFKEDPSGLSTIIELLDFNLFDKAGAALGRIAGHMKKLAEMSFGKLKDILVYIAEIWGKGITAVVDTVAGEGTTDRLVKSGVAGAAVITKAVSDVWTNTKLKTNVDKFTNAQLAAFEKLKESNEGLGASMEKELGMSYKQFILNSLKGVKTQEEFEIAMSLVQGKLTGLSNTFKKGASDILDFGKNVGVGSKAMAAFGNKMKKKNEFRELGKDVQSSIAAIQNLKGATEGSDGKANFLAELKKAAMAGEVSFEDFGLTAEIIAEKGVDAFTPLQNAITAVADESEVAKNAIARIKSELKGLQDAAKNKALKSLFDNKTANLLAYGRFELSLGQKIKDNKAIYDDQMKLNADVDKKKKDLIDRQFKLEGLKLDMLKLQNKGNKDALAIIAEMRKEMEGNVTAQKAVVTTGTQGADASAKSSFYSRQQTNKSGQSPGTGSGIAVVDTMKGFQENLTAFDKTGKKVFLTMQQAFGTFNEEGGLLFNNFGAQVAMSRQILSPMLNDLKKLGPEGEVAAAVGEGMLTLQESFANLGDTIEQVFDVKASASFDGFITAWEGASMEDKARVLAAGFSAVAGAIGSLASTMAAASRNRIAGIDNEIKAEKARDGNSVASQAKLAKLEAKKEKVKKKAFEMDKKLRIAQAIMSTAAGVAAALSNPLTFWLAPVIAALGAVQIGIISGTSYQGTGGGGGGGGVEALSMGKRNNTVDLGKGNNAGGELGYMRGESGTGTGATDFKPTPAFTGAKYRASGGETAGFMVGEQGPEMFIPDRAGRIAPAGEVQAVGGSTNVSFNIQAVDAAGVEDVLLQQKGHIIRMIREAANEHGQNFLEDIGTETYS